MILALLLAAASGRAEAPQLLTGIDGSVVRQSWQPTAAAERRTVIVCARNAAPHKTTRGLSFGAGAPVAIPPGHSHCRFVAPIKQVFILWTYDPQHGPARSISTSLDLTQRIDQLLSFEWIE
jgi:2-polyprenyl-6-methoxyphenol hydroxylase-like FAD-dependent oxidoreductase